MSSRAEEKAKRRQERMEAEAAAARTQGRAKRLQLAGGVILALALIGVLVAVVLGGGSSSSKSSDGPNNAKSDATIPPQKIADFNAAVKASGCTYEKLPIQGRGHTTEKVDYDTNPPASGPHNPNAAQDGKYDPGNQPATENWVHSLEHGRVVTMYKVGTPQRTIDQLSALFDERLNGTEGYHQLLLQNTTKMPYDVAMVAWGQSLTCKTMTPAVFDAFRAFRKRFVDKGPEFFP